MTSINKATIVHDSVTKLKTFLTNNLASGTVYTAHPHKATNYPYITLTHAGYRDEHASIGEQYKQVTLIIRIEVWAQSTKERDEIWDDIYDELRHHYITADANGDSITSLGLHNMQVLSSNDIDTDSPLSEGHIHRKISEIQFTYYAA